MIPQRTTLSIFGFKGGQLVTRWCQADSAFQVQPLSELPAAVNTNAGTGTTTMLTVPAKQLGRPMFVTRRTVDPSAGRVELTAWQGDEQGCIRHLGSITGTHADAIAGRTTEDGRTELLVRVSVADDRAGQVVLSSATASLIASRLEGIPLSTPVVGRLAPAGSPTVVVQGACERVAAFQLASQMTPGRVVWRIPGRGIYTGSGRFAGGASFGGVVLADLLGDGALATVTSTSAPDGHAQLVAVDPAGRVLWRHDFDDLPVHPPEWNIGGLTLWFAGRFTDRGRSDVLASVRRSTMHSDETLLLDGRTGRQLWHRAQGANAAGNQRACGGSWMAVYDHDGDGLDDALCLYPDVVSVFQGRTGKLLLDRHTNHDVFKEAWTMYAVPVVADFLHKGRPQILYGANSTVFGLLGLDGTPVWKHGPSPGWPDVLPGIGDIDGDGAIELLSPGHRLPDGTAGQEVRCYDAATGRLDWTLKLAGAEFSSDSSPPMTPAVADIDGDGRDEAIMAIGRTLLAIGSTPDKKAGVIRWSLSFPDRLGPPAVADSLGRGDAQVVEVCADGNVYGVGDAEDR